MYIFILYASCIAIILFGIYHYINIKGDYEENPDKKYDITTDLLNVNNIMIFIIIFAFSLLLIYFSFDEKNDILSMIG
jgi:ABC-type transport system involved in multi-copper enzyme maturation permease subunit